MSPGEQVLTTRSPLVFLGLTVLAHAVGVNMELGSYLQ
jgi:hypothetical protein